MSGIQLSHWLKVWKLQKQDYNDTVNKEEFETELDEGKEETGKIKECMGSS